MQGFGSRAHFDARYGLGVQAHARHDTCSAHLVEKALRHLAVVRHVGSHGRGEDVTVRVWGIWGFYDSLRM